MGCLTVRGDGSKGDVFHMLAGLPEPLGSSPGKSAKHLCLVRHSPTLPMPTPVNVGLRFASVP